MSFSGESLHTLAYKNKKFALNAIQSDIKLKKEILSKLEPLIKNLEELSADQERLRNGSVKFTIGVLNSGKTDGVIYPDAKLKFGSTELNLNKEEEVMPKGFYYSYIKDDKYSVIEAHSFKELTFVVNIDKNIKENYDKWISHVNKFEQEKFQIELKTGDDYIYGAAQLPP